MDTCFNCGASVRAGAKFCTSCGTRLIEDTTPDTARTGSSQWHATTTDETQVAAPVAEESTETSGGDTNNTSFGSWGRSESAWGSTESSSSGSTSPADRFEAALDREASSREETGTSGSESSFGWGTSPSNDNDRFASWAAAYGTSSTESTSEDTESEGDDTSAQDVAETPVESVTITSVDAMQADTRTEVTPESRDAAGFSENGTTEVDYLSGDEHIGAGGTDSGIAAGRPASQSGSRERAAALVEELREIIAGLGDEQTTPATGDLESLRGVREETPDFSDLQAIIESVRQTPKDIDVLRELGTHAARLEELLESHQRLVSAIDDATSSDQ